MVWTRVWLWTWGGGWFDSGHFLKVGSAGFADELD